MKVVTVDLWFSFLNAEFIKNGINEVMVTENYNIKNIMAKIVLLKRNEDGKLKEREKWEARKSVKLKLK